MLTNPTKEEFLSNARKEFAFLIREFGCTEKKPEVDENDFCVKYENDSVQVKIEGINWGFGVQVLIKRLDIPGGEMSQIPLWAIEEVRNPGKRKVGGDQLQQLMRLSRSLKLYGSDILKGDFSIFREAYNVIFKV